jgi:hypothetical protein
MRKDGFSIIRIGLIAGVVGIILIGLGFVAFLTDQASRRVPFAVAVYPTAQEWGMTDVTTFSRKVLYRVTDSTPEQVALFYQQELNAHNGSNDELCVRLPPTGEYVVPENEPYMLRYQYTCVFDNSGFNATQYTIVKIYPGYFHPDPTLDTRGLTIIEFEQNWQP